MGLQRSFQAAGARAVVASLWKVDDAATSVLMEQFYANLWSKKLPKLEALRQAQLTVLNKPDLVKARREDLAMKGEVDKKGRTELAEPREVDDKEVKLPEGGTIARAKVPSPRSNPALWAAFVLSGDSQ